MSEWREFQNPWWLLLLIPLVLGMFFQGRVHYIGKLHSYLFSGNRGRIRTRVRFAFSSFLVLLSLFFLLVALADLTRGYVAIMAEKVVQRFIVWVDSSSSMTWVQKPGRPERIGYGDKIPCRGEVVAFYPRIDGACRAVYRIIDEVGRSNKGKRQSEQDLIAIGQFAADSFVVAYLSNDHSRLKEKVDRMNLAVLLLGTYEILHDQKTPAKVYINEYVNIAKKYCPNDSQGFINSILDKLAKDHAV